MIEFMIRDAVPGLAVALVEARDVRLAAADETLLRSNGMLLHEVRELGPRGGDARRTAVRDLLRRGGYKPAGRNKPAQEYLLRTFQEEGALPAIYNAVDALNAVSLVTGLPISLIALNRVGTSLCLRLGRAGERFVFNRTGQELDVAGLLCVCQVTSAGEVPVGTPVKDSMLGKVTEDDHHLLACIYAPQAEITSTELTQAAELLASSFSRYCGASACEHQLLPKQW